jgi:hypothetical protein
VRQRAWCVTMRSPMGEPPESVPVASCVRLAIIVGQVLLASCTNTTIIVNPASDESNDGAPAPVADGSTDAPSSNAMLDATMARSDALVAPNEASVVQTGASIDAGAATDSAATQTDAPGPVGEAVEAATDGPTSETDAEIDGGRSRCDANGMNCRCFNVASLGYGGHVGSQLGMGGTDNTQSFGSYLNQQSNALFAQVGCGVDIGCTNPDKPDLSDPNFLPSYDVLIFQWMAGALLPVTNGGGNIEGYEGSNYWAFSQAELDALKAWVMAGGGVIVLTGYDYSSDELTPTNQILTALTDMSYTATDTYGMTETGNAEFCLGDSDPVTGWAPAPDPIGENILAVGAFHGHAIQAGANAVIDCEDNTFGICAAHEDVGRGHVYVFTDEWVTYTSQWNPNAQPATYCALDGSTANGDFPAVQAAYQVPQFWYNAIRYASQATGCPFSLAGAIGN